MKRLAGRRWTIGKIFVEKTTGYRGASGRDTRIKLWNLQSAQDWDLGSPLSGITVHVLSHGMRVSALGGDSVRNGQPESSSRQTNR